MNNKDYMFFRTLGALSLTKVGLLLFGMLTILSLFSWIITNMFVYFVEMAVWLLYFGIMIYHALNLGKAIEKYGGKFK